MSWPLYVLKNGLGEPWWAFVNLAQGDVTPFEPPVARAITMFNGGGKVLTGRPVLLSYHYDYLAGAANVGFDLYWADYRTGARIQRKIFGVQSAAAGRVEGGAQCFSVAPPGTLVSPGPPPLTRPSSNLFCDVTATAPTFGSLLLTGYWSDSDNPLSGNLTGSPFTLSG